MILSENLRTVIWDYFIANKAKLKFKNIQDFTKSFNGESDIVNTYLSALSLSEHKEAMRQLSSAANRQSFEMHIKAQVARFIFRDNGYYAVKLKDDDVVNKALTVLNTNQYTKILGK